MCRIFPSWGWLVSIDEWTVRKSILHNELHAEVKWKEPSSNFFSSINCIELNWIEISLIRGVRPILQHYAHAISSFLMFGLPYMFRWMKKKPLHLTVHSNSILLIKVWWRIRGWEQSQMNIERHELYLVTNKVIRAEGERHTSFFQFQFTSFLMWNHFEAFVHIYKYK